MQRGLPQPGDVVAGKYVIARLLGRGGMGAVYVVEHRITGKRLALKCLLPEHLEHPEFIERFLREAQAAGRIQHRNVVDVFDVGQDGELLYIVMELLEGKPLAVLLREGKLDLEEVLQIIIRAMEGVAAAHAVGIVHRDLKPDNIFVCVGQSGRLDDPRVLDFGISKLEDDIQNPLTRSGVMLGTPYYMAFEQINSQRDLDQRVDVYAMGVILYEAMCGQPPYVAESVGALAIRMMTEPPMPLSMMRPELPEELARVVMRSIARDRNERYPTMEALVDALRPFVADPSRVLIPQGRGTPLRPSLRSPYADDATLPAAWSMTPTPHDSAARLRLHAQDQTDEGLRTPSPPAASKTLLMLGGAALATILLGVVLILTLRGSGTPSTESMPVEPPARAPAAMPPPLPTEPQPHPATAAGPTNTPSAVPSEPPEIEPPEATPPPSIAVPVEPPRTEPTVSPRRAAAARRRLSRGWAHDEEVVPPQAEEAGPVTPIAPAQLEAAPEASTAPSTVPAAPEPTPNAPSQPTAEPPAESAPPTAEPNVPPFQPANDRTKPAENAPTAPPQ